MGMINSLVPDRRASFMMRKGFTLFEVMVAILIVSIIAVGGLGFTFHSARVIEGQKNTRVAYEIACERMELVMATPFTQLSQYAKELSIDADDFDETFYVELDIYDVRTWTVDKSSSPLFETVGVKDEDAADGDVQISLTLRETDEPGDTEAGMYFEIEVRVRYGSDKKRSVVIKNYHPGLMRS